MTALWVLLGIFGYLMVAGVAGTIAANRGAERCWRERHDGCTHVAGEFFIALFWMIAVPVFLGLGTARLVQRYQPVNRAERRRAQELAEADHKVELARLARAAEEETNRRLDLMIEPEWREKP